MILDRFIPAKYNIRTAICAIEVVVSETGTNWIVTRLKKKNGKLFLSELNIYKNREQLPADINEGKVPLIFIFNGKGVIQKKLQLSTTDKKMDEIVSENLPSIKLSDFYIQLYRQADKTAFLSMCRKESVLNLLPDLASGKMDIVDFFIGSGVISSLLGFFAQDFQLQASCHRISVENGIVAQIISSEPDNSEVSLEDLKFPSAHLLGVSAGLSYFAQLGVYETNARSIELLKLNHANNNKFRFALTSIIILFFFLSFINAATFSSFFKEGEMLDQELLASNARYEEVTELIEKYEKNKRLIENSGILRSTNLSEYADKISSTVPDEVILTELLINPAKKKPDNDVALFENRKIVMRGICQDSYLLNEWIGRLREHDFVKQVSIEKFVYDTQVAFPNFEIVIFSE